MLARTRQQLVLAVLAHVGTANAFGPGPDPAKPVHSTVLLSQARSDFGAAAAGGMAVFGGARTFLTLISPGCAPFILYDTKLPRYQPAKSPASG